jgi:site-specific recombinase XerD
LPALLHAYVEHRRSQRGVVAGTVRRDISVATEFLTTLRSRGRTIGTTRIVDIDAFVDGMFARLSRSFVGDRCSSLRQFLRFLRVTGRLRQDLATAVVGPRIRVGTRPPRALPWADIQRMLRAVPRRRPVDLRDHAMLLLLASYGMGSSEAASLRLEDINWADKTLRVHRQKTGVSIELPLSPSVARALVAYLRCGRPRHCMSREVFVTVGLPHNAITANALRHRVHKYGSLAGIPAELCSSHVFRHSHATRQIDLGATPKVVSDILGHRHPSSTSAYVRVALRRLRPLALPVPR